MKEKIIVKRTSSSDKDFQLLIEKLDDELWNELNEDQSTYDQYNKVPGINTVIVIYENEKPVSCGCFKKYTDDTAEIKRMFVEKEHRGKGLSKLVLEELENWARESGFQNAVLETSVHFKTARSLYTHAGYEIITNYGQYAGLEESVCMKKELVKQESSVLKKLKNIEYFGFEEDFMDGNVRCIPMMVRFKLDACCIKLKLAEWSKFKTEEKEQLAAQPCGTTEEKAAYKKYLQELILNRTGNEATELAPDEHPAWAEANHLTPELDNKAKEFGWEISIEQWKSLTSLQRFALLKLCRPGHENKNFPKAMKEFNLIK
jgi:putative acetyltransferase